MKMNNPGGQCTNALVFLCVHGLAMIAVVPLVLCIADYRCCCSTIFLPLPGCMTFSGLGPGKRLTIQMDEDVKEMRPWEMTTQLRGSVFSYTFTLFSLGFFWWQQFLKPSNSWKNIWGLLGIFLAQLQMMRFFYSHAYDIKHNIAYSVPKHHFTFTVLRETRIWQRHNSLLCFQFSKVTVYTLVNGL